MRITALFFSAGAAIPFVPKRSDADLTPAGLRIWLMPAHVKFARGRADNDSGKINPATLPRVDRGQYEFARMRNLGSIPDGPA